MKKRRNNGRNKKNCGATPFVRCDNCSRAVPKDKAIKRFRTRALVDSASLKDVRDAMVFDTEVPIPRSYYKMQYCVACAIHSRIVRGRSRDDRRIRVHERPQRSQKPATKS